jgi:PHAX RNA-binding domain
MRPREAHQLTVTAACTEIAAALQEPNVALVKAVVQVIGHERAKAICAEALRVEASGGLLTEDKSRRRSPGGTFFYLVRQRISRKEFYRIFRPGVSATSSRETLTQPCTWADVTEATSALAQAAAEATTMKVTLVGRPSATQTRGRAIIFQLKGKPPGNLPKELPAPPKTPMTWTVVVGMRQWDKVKDSLTQHPDDRLVCEGYPCRMGEQDVLLVTNCSSVNMQQARKAEQQAAAAGKGP